MGGKANRANFGGGSAQQGARFKSGAIGGQFEQRYMGSGADDLQKTKAIDRRPFERLGQQFVDGRPGGFDPFG